MMRLISTFKMLRSSTRKDQKEKKPNHWLLGGWHKLVIENREKMLVRSSKNRNSR
jgi:hypothetical protein